VSSPLIPPPRGRGASWNPPNRFERLHVEPDLADLEDAGDLELPAPETQYFHDRTQTVIARNDSPDVGFDAGINPYRGCSNGCTYCFARPSHEYLGFSAGLDFETKILVKEDAPELLRRELSSSGWEPQVIALSGNTDCYQPVERRLGITRRCLEVLAEFRNPVGVITKSHLVTRDADLLAELASVNAASVNVSVTTLDAELARTMEPRTSTPARRLVAIEKLARAGVPVGVLVAPVIPGLTEHELPRILQAAADAGASFAGYVPIKLPHAVAPLFERWLEERYPEKKGKVLGRIREMRGGRLNDPRFGYRQRGEGPLADAIASLFAAGCQRAGLATHGPALSTAAFRWPANAASPQTDLFS
jgi:DNA repair photolyase